MVSQLKQFLINIKIMNPHSNLASFYRYFYMTETLPNNLCNYFWGLMFAVICLPFTWLAILHNRVYNPIQKKSWDYGNGDKGYYYSTPYKPIMTGIGLVFTLFTLIIGGMSLILIEQITGIDARPFISNSTIAIGLFKLYSFGILMVFGSIALFYLVMGLWRLLPKKAPETDEEYYARRAKESERDKERREYRKNNPSIFTLAWRWIVAFKEKNCPLITWDYTKKD